jgi:hypothetical protein
MFSGRRSSGGCCATRVAAVVDAAPQGSLLGEAGRKVQSRVGVGVEVEDSPSGCRSSGSGFLASPPVRVSDWSLGSGFTVGLNL